MKQVIALMVAGVMAVLLTACGQQAPKQPDVKTQVEVQPAVAAQPAAAQPAEAQPAAAKE